MATKVKIVGFEMKLANNVTLIDLFQAASSSSGQELKINGRLTYSLCHRLDHYMAGVVLRYKGDRKSIETLMDDDGNLRVEKATLKEGHRSTEASLYCINPTTLKGVFYQYAGSISTTGFYKLLKASHDRIVKQKIKDKVNELTNFELNKVSKHSREKAKKEARAMYSGKFELTLVLKELDINAVIDKLHRLDKIQIKASSALDKAPLFQPLEPWSESAEVTVRLSAPNDRTKLVQSIKEFVSSITVPITSKGKAIKLIGKSATGQDEWYWLGENLQHYGTINYDDYVEQLPYPLWVDYPSCSAMNELKTVLRNHQPVFGYLPQPKHWPVPVPNVQQAEPA